MKLAVIADPAAALGFRLAGFLAYGATTPEEAKKRLEELVQVEDIALVAVDQSLLPEPEKAVERLLRGKDLPVLLPISGLKDAFQNPDVEAYMRTLVRQTIGFDIKL
ncbi:MAG: V-type ATP synthase subunit F [Thermus sp.]|uniref:V-type ATP synthase subunit F n=1 Tax=Thermus sp. TaxID=275 RepID=UPI003328B65F